MTNKQIPVEITLYYANWCGHCKMFKPKWEQIKTDNENNSLKLEEGVKLTLKQYEESELNDNPTIPHTINGEEIQGWPTIKVVINSKEYSYEGVRDALVDYVNKKIKTTNQKGGSQVNYRNKYKKYKKMYAGLVKEYKNLNKIYKQINK